jgi:protein required for attachment to host cells
MCSSSIGRKNMQNHFGYKLVAVLDMNMLKLFKAEGLKITEEVGKFQLHENEERNVERHESLRGNKSGLSAFHDPHTSKKDIDLNGSSRAALDHINQIFVNDSAYKELYIIASSKLLGHLRQMINSKLKKLVTKEVNKDLINHSIKDIEKAIFA